MKWGRKSVEGLLEGSLACPTFYSANRVPFPTVCVRSDERENVIRLPIRFATTAFRQVL